jgi:competence protein ComEA
MAGGLKPTALTGGLDFSQTVHEGLQLTIPCREKLEEIKQGTRPLTGEDLLSLYWERERSGDTDIIDLNEAGHWELQSLPEIGPIMAQRIIDYREQAGGFSTIEELKEVPGIGEITFKQLKGRVQAR